MTGQRRVLNCTTIGGKRKHLVEAVEQNENHNCKPEARNKSLDPRPSKKVQIGCMHYNEGQQRYVPVRMARGGGTRDVEMPHDADVEHVEESASHFFPKWCQQFFYQQETFKLNTFISLLWCSLDGFLH